MKRIFQHKYILSVLTFLALALPLIHIITWKIEKYNLQNSSFTFLPAPTPNYLFIILSLAFFLSLIFTKRIILSTLFIFLSCIQVFLVASILSKIEKPDWWFSYAEKFAEESNGIVVSLLDFYLEFLVLAILLASSFWLANSICRVYSKRFQSEIILK